MELIGVLNDGHQLKPDLYLYSSMAPLTGEDFHNPALTGPRTSHFIPNGGLFSAYASVRINASPEIVYRAILKVGDYSKWNTFVQDVTITKNPSPHHRKDGSTNSKRMTGGTCMIFHSELIKNPQYKTNSREVATLVEGLKLAKDGHSSPCITRIRWSLDNAAISTPGFILRSERTNEIEEAHDGTTVYRTWQTFNGPVARIIRNKFEKALQARLADWCRDLKAWCEKIEESSGGEGAIEAIAAQK